MGIVLNYLSFSEITILFRLSHSMVTMVKNMKILSAQSNIIIQEASLSDLLYPHPEYGIFTHIRQFVNEITINNIKSNRKSVDEFTYFRRALGSIRGDIKRNSDNGLSPNDFIAAQLAIKESINLANWNKSRLNKLSIKSEPWIVNVILESLGDSILRGLKSLTITNNRTECTCDGDRVSLASPLYYYASNLNIIHEKVKCIYQSIEKCILLEELQIIHSVEISQNHIHPYKNYIMTQHNPEHILFFSYPKSLLRLTLKNTHHSIDKLRDLIIDRNSILKELSILDNCRILEEKYMIHTTSESLYNSINAWSDDDNDTKLSYFGPAVNNSIEKFTYVFEFPHINNLSQLSNLQKLDIMVDSEYSFDFHKMIEQIIGIKELTLRNTNHVFDLRDFTTLKFLEKLCIINCIFDVADLSKLENLINIICTDCVFYLEKADRNTYIDETNFVHYKTMILSSFYTSPKIQQVTFNNCRFESKLYSDEKYHFNMPCTKTCKEALELLNDLITVY
jgi:hypothetical protein